MGAGSDTRLYAAIGPDAPVEWVFGVLHPADRAELMSALLRLAEVIADGSRALAERGYEYGGYFALGLWGPDDPLVEATISRSIRVTNEDRSQTTGATDLVMSIAPVGDPPDGAGWSVTTWVGTNCNRLMCPEDPHSLLELVEFAASGREAVDALERQFDAALRWAAGPGAVGAWASRR